LEAVNKYQSKNPEIFKATNLEAVKKYQSQNHEVFKTANLDAVQKHQSRNAEYFKKANLEAVQTYKNTNPDKVKQSNLEAFQTYKNTNPDKVKQSNLESVYKYRKKKAKEFPPSPPSQKLQHTIISNFCKDTAPNKFTESGCAVCGKLVVINDLFELSGLEIDLSVLCQTGVTVQERFSTSDPIIDKGGPVLDNSLSHICQSCKSSVSMGKLPLMALANGKWLGQVPPQLANLSFAEQLLVARVRHNRCIVKVSSGMHTMRANAIMFANPMPKIYNVLPPSID
jgi:hypothetical protein